MEGGHLTTIACSKMHKEMPIGSDERFLKGANTQEARVANYIWAVRSGRKQLKGKYDAGLPNFRRT